MSDDLSPERLSGLLGRLQKDRPAAAAAVSSWLARVEAARPTPKPARFPAATPRSARPVKLTIGMAVHDDFDGVYFTAQAIRLFHPEVTEETEILVVDNDPTNVGAEALKALAASVPGYRYVPYDRWKSTAVRDVVFREAAGDFVLCVDSHVLLAPGALRRLIDYVDLHPQTNDLLQGPMLWDDGKMVTHMNPVWRGGMFGAWADPWEGDVNGEPFEILMHGLGLFGCRRSAWPGFNPRFVGFGGEEGYLHERFRRRGDRTLCLPFLRWLHRFIRPRSASYANTWQDRIRNYVIGFSEVGLDLAPVRAHFSDFLAAGDNPERLFEDALADLRNPFSYFDGIYLISFDGETVRREDMARQFEALGIAWRVRYISAIESPENPDIGHALSHRAVIEEARRLGLRHMLVFADDCLFPDDVPTIVGEAVAEIERIDWSLLYLGGRGANGPAHAIPGLQRLVRPDGAMGTQAIAYSQGAFDRLLQALPATTEGAAAWLATEGGLDQYFARCWATESVAIRPSTTTQPAVVAREHEGRRGASDRHTARPSAGSGAVDTRGGGRTTAGAILDPAVLRDAMRRRLTARIHATGQITFPALPAAADEYTSMVARLFDALSRGYSQEDCLKLRDALFQHATEAFAKSPESVVVFTYDTEKTSDAVSWGARSIVISTAQKYEEWLAERTPPLFGTHPDAKLLAVARELGRPEEVAFLDVGAGPGRNALPMARAGYPTDALESSPAFASELRELASREGLAIIVAGGDFWDPSLALPRERYRLVLLSEVNSNLRGVAWIRQLLERLVDVLEPGGVGLFSLFLTEPGFEPDTLMREFSEVAWSPIVKRDEIVAAAAGLPLDLISDDEVLGFEKAHQPTWPPTAWYHGWVGGQDLFDLPEGQTPVRMRWIAYRRT